MKNYSGVVLAAALLLFQPLVMAQMHNGIGQGGMSQGGMMGPSGSMSGSGMHSGAMLGHQTLRQQAQQMQQQMQRIHASNDPTERQRLMREHMAQMQQYMHTMQGKGQVPAAGTLTMEQLRTRMEAMETLMQQMLEQMSLQQHHQGSPE